MGSSISIRALTNNDWQTLAAIRLEALQDSPQYFGATYENESKYTPEQWRNWLKPGLEIVFGLFDGTKTIGMTGLMTTREDASVGQCIASYINPAYRRRGLSGILYKTRIDWHWGICLGVSLLCRIVKGMKLRGVPTKNGVLFL